MPGRRMTRQGEREALRRIEKSARTTGEFSELVNHYNKLDSNARRRYRYHEVKTVDYKLLDNTVGRKYKGTDPEQREAERAFGYSDGGVVPVPIQSEYWREQMRGSFINTMCDNREDMWNLAGDELAAIMIKELTKKQKDVVFRRVLRNCHPDNIAECTGKTVRGVNKVYALAMKRIRSLMAEDIQLKRSLGMSVPPYKLRFLEWYNKGCPRGSEKAKKRKKPAITPGGQEG